MLNIDPDTLEEIASHSQPLDTPELTWQCASDTHIGRVRPVNEDAFFSLPEQGLWAVADGMGGHSRGDFASKAVVKALAGFVQQSTLEQNLSDLDQRLNQANDACRNTFKRKKVGTTAAIFFIFKQQCFCLWAGDTRVYRLRNQQVEQLTEDHSVAQEKYARGELSQDEAAVHPSAHQLTRAVGAHATLRLDLRYASVHNGDRYLVCSDGVYNGMSLADIQSRLERGTPEDALKQLIDRALDLGGRDNITGIVIDTAQPTATEQH